MNEKVRINTAIRAKELRVIGASGENLGVISLSEALEHASKAGLDLIEISAKAVPPVAKIMDFGKFQYEQNKKNREIKSHARIAETKSVQIKIGTGEHDLTLKAARVIEWLREGHRVKIDLFLWGRYKYMDFEFLKERMKRFLAIITEPYKIADDIKRGPKGLTMIIERDTAKTTKT